MSIINFKDILDMNNLIQVQLGIRSLKTDSVPVSKRNVTFKDPKTFDGKVSISVLKDSCQSHVTFPSCLLHFPYNNNHTDGDKSALSPQRHSQSMYTQKGMCNCLKKQKRAWLKDPNAAYSLTSVYMVNRCGRWACLSGCWCQKVTKMVKHSFPFSPTSPNAEGVATLC